ncbi:hypothetical protein CROQUDRAFT_655850 [Cronartium quercuum f. sp. fusiforme G11]|uniref:CRAL-TRIO domain-containing protein n=1 Tax=Cronartium quercuum f. sp. fusiforme G11 TaxID=708437 RepID=A0A9P6NP13_9BASI|nr:hypothetical protein CROQUDRAFT_655850 [Cronartium quercuum f. sp. fusiforme G11]
MDSDALKTNEQEKRFADEEGFNEAETETLKKFWKRLFGLLGLNSTSTQLNGAAGRADELDQIIAKHGRERYAEALWSFTTLEDPDHVAIKFIRARKHVIENAVKMFVECLQWRIEADVDLIVAKGELGFMTQPGYDGQAFTHQFSSGKTFVQGFSKIGGPVSYLIPRFHKSSEQSEEVMNDFIAYAMECLRIFTTNLRSKVTVIIDLAGFGLSNMDWKAVMYFNKCLEAYYPESLQLVIIHNAPWVFQGVWKVLGPMLDPVVHSKIKFTKSTQDIHVYVDERYLFKEHGGSSTWKLLYKPPSTRTLEIDQARKTELMAQRKELVVKYVDETNSWINGSSVRNLVSRHFLALMMRVQGLSLDPYIRSTTFYHQVGGVLPNGLVGFSLREGEADREYRGHPRSREQVLEKIEEMKARFKTEDVDFPVINFQL